VNGVLFQKTQAARFKIALFLSNPHGVKQEGQSNA